MRAALLALVMSIGMTEARAELDRPARQVPITWLDAAKPGFALPGLDGALHRLESHAGRPVAVHFFATWCAPCVEELPALQAFVDRGDEPSLAVLTIDVGEVDIRVRRFFERMRVGFPVLLDRDRAVSRAWDVPELPATYLFDRNQRMRFAITGEVDWAHPATLAAVRRLAGTPAQDTASQ